MYRLPRWKGLSPGLGNDQALLCLHLVTCFVFIRLQTYFVYIYMKMKRIQGYTEKNSCPVSSAEAGKAL